MNLTVGSLQECKTFFDAYNSCTRQRKSYNYNKDLHQNHWRLPIMIGKRQLVVTQSWQIAWTEILSYGSAYFQ
jgi:hypothetical protein